MAVAGDPHIDMLLDQLWRFMRADVYPLEPHLLHDGFRALLPVLHEKRQKAKALGLWAPFLPEEYGGLGLRLPEFARVSEVLGHSPLGHYLLNCQAPDVGNMEILMEAGSEQQKKQFLEPLARGEIRSCFAMTEPENPGSNPVLLNATAVKDGDDYMINGHKWFTSAADGAAFTIAMVVTNPDAPSRHARASQIIVPLDTPGFRIVRNISIMGETGGDWLSHAEVMFENCRVPQSNLLGKDGQGFALAQVRLGPGRIHHCMRWIGICERAFDMMCARAATRELSTGKPLATRQVIQHWIAESRANIDAARLLVLDAADNVEQHGAHAARINISEIKFFVANVMHELIDRAIQVHGALGITDDTLLSFWYRHERGARIYDGADEVHKSVVAREVLKKYGVDVSL
ncbi:MAG TPA: acyl-CoA dehydrogenase family protein [Roseiflexaceae bacterium]|nr:acyl-CoA dehydrogenase family protein [Roseiflexaceae bacterium]